MSMRIKTRIEKIEGKMPKRRKCSPTDQIVFGPDCTFEMVLAEFREERANLTDVLAIKEPDDRPGSDAGEIHEGSKL